MIKDESSGGANDDEQEYCICKSKDASRFMIGCDRCNQWFHGECMSITATMAKTIKRYYCPSCITANSQLTIVYKDPPATTSRKSSNTTTIANTTTPAPNVKRKSEPELPRCGNCIGCFRTEDCGKCDACKKTTTNGGGCANRKCVNAEILMMSNSKLKKVVIGQQPQLKLAGAATKKPPKAAKKPIMNTAAAKRAAAGRTGAKRGPKPGGGKSAAGGTAASQLRGTRSTIKAYQKFMKEAGVISSDDETNDGRQCFGPQCTQAARIASKYCSDECGLALAKARLCTFLPSRVTEYWQTPPIAEVRQKQQLESVRDKQQKTRDRLSQLDDEANKLSLWVKTINELDFEAEDETTDDDEIDQMLYCTVCGMEVAIRLMPKHVARCFAKYESQSSYGSAFKATNNPYDVFCDAYNKTSATYCKRLRVICPEHSKSTTTAGQNDDEMACGCPTNWVGAQIPDPAQINAKHDYEPVFCTTMRKKCRKHYQWDRIARALIDSERLTLLFKLDELFEEERNVRVALASRGSVIALLTHTTVCHK